MFRILTASAVALALLCLASAPAQAATRKTAKKPAAAAAEPVVATNDSLNPGQLAMADRVLTGVADCEFKQKVAIERIAGHSGNFRITFDRKTYVMVPEETTTGAIRLVDTGGAVVWIQIPMKSMLMNQREHHRLVDNCLEDEQRIAVEASQKAAANATMLTPAIAAALANGSTVSTVTTTTETFKVIAPEAAGQAAGAPAPAAAPASAASGSQN